MSAQSDRIEALLANIDRHLAKLSSLPPLAAPAQRGIDLDGQYGNPEVRQKDPRDWHGDSMKGRKFSECPPEYLDLLAERFDYFASKAASDLKDAEDDEQIAAAKKKQKFAALDAARARGWAARLRSGWKPQASEMGGDW